MRFRHKVACAIIGLPVTAGVGLGGYIQYRVMTRPATHQFHKVLDDRGALVLEGKLIPKPSGWAVAARSAQLFLIFFPIGVLYVLTSWNAFLYRIWVKVMLHAIEVAGPVFVKIGQWSCTREDLFSKPFRDQCKRLYNEVAVHPFKVSLKTIEEDLKADPYTIFETIEETTCGSGSIGQVHAATLKGEEQRKVVIKVMHPGIVDIISRDFLVLQFCARVLDKYVPSVSRFELPQLASAFCNHLATQLDFRIEAENLAQFRHNFRHCSFVSFPEPIMSTQRVLVESFCEGQPAHPSYLASLPAPARSKLAGNGLNIWCQMLLRDNFIHGDMHPGNILIDCSDVSKPHVYLIDVGLCQQLDESEAEISRHLLESFVRWDASLCANTIWRMTDHQRFGSLSKFEERLKDVFRRFRPSRNDQNAVSNILESVFLSIREERIQMDPPFVSLLFAVLILESFIMSLDPSFNLVRHTAPWLVSEGKISKGVVKNFVKSHVHNMKRSVQLRIAALKEPQRVAAMAAAAETG